MSNKVADLRNVALTSIRTNPVALRELDAENESFKSLVHDVARRGVLNSLTVREKTDEATGESYFEIVDGLHRYSAACEAGLETVPVNVIDASESEMIETQVVANLVRVETQPVKYTQALHKLMALNPAMTVNELAERISQSPTYVTNRFNLLKLDAPIQKLVDDGSIPLSNAFALSKLPKANQHEFVDAAIAQQPKEFVPAVTQRGKEIRAAAREGRDAASVGFVSVARLRKMSEIKDELAGPSAGPALCAHSGLTTAVEGFKAGIEWVLSQDPMTFEADKAKYEEGVRLRDEASKKRAAERAATKAKEAAEKAAKAREEAGLTEDEVSAAVTSAE